MEIRYAGNTEVEAVQMGNAEFDTYGKMTRYTENFAKGKKMAEYVYEYDDHGKLVRNTVSLVFNDWTPVEFLLSFDAGGKLICRELAEALPNFWQKETYVYNALGVLIKSEQWYSHNGTLEAMGHREYPPSIAPKENSLTYIHDAKGLLMLHQFYGKSGTVEKAMKYEYEYY